MKKFILIIVVIGLHSCSPKLQPQNNYSAAVEFLYKETEGTIAVKSTAFGKKKEIATGNAQQNAFNIILFKGIPGTDIKVPLIENESEAKSKHSDYFNKFFGQGGYTKYMMSSTYNSEPVKVKGGYWASLDIKINFNSLRKDLEQNQIIRKFGF